MSTEGSYSRTITEPQEGDEEIDIVTMDLESSTSSDECTPSAGRDIRINPYHALALAARTNPVPEIEQCRIKDCSFAPPGHRIHPIINDKTNEEHRERLISDEDESDEDIQIVPGHSKTANTGNEVCARSIHYSEVRPVVNVSTVEAYLDVEESWWRNLNKQYPPEEQCRVPNCPVAPAGHKKHSVLERNYSLFESRLIIQYLYHQSDIQRGKGLLVWDEMHSRGYMKHRTAQSLNNNFKKYLLNDIKLFRLPPDVESEFLALR